MKSKNLYIRADEEMVEKLKDIAYELRLPVSEIVRQGLELCIKALEEQHGGPYPKRK